MDTAGNLFISDQGNYRIRKVANGVITTIVGTGMAAMADPPLLPGNAILGKWVGSF